MGSRKLKFIPGLAIILCMVSCGDDDGTDIYDFYRCGLNAAYTGYFIATLDITNTGDQCDPADIPPTPTRIEFGDVGVDADCDLFLDGPGLLNGQMVLMDFWGDLGDDWMRLITANGDVITFFVMDFEDGDTILGIFWWDVTIDCVVEGNFTIIIE